jgi:HK97 family phage major capsid protein
MMYPPTPGPAVMKGRPIVWAEQASQLGTVGDITLADLSTYILVDGGIRPAISADARFLNDEWVFRFTLRVDGAPAYASAITPYSGSASKSPYVTLAAR